MISSDLFKVSESIISRELTLALFGLVTIKEKVEKIHELSSLINGVILDDDLSLASKQNTIVIINSQIMALTQGLK